MNVIINGEIHVRPTNESFHALLDALTLDPQKIAIERNKEIVPHSQYASTILNEGDEIEIVHFIGGG